MKNIFLLVVGTILTFGLKSYAENEKSSPVRKVASEVDMWNSQILASKNKTDLGVFLKALAESKSTSFETRFYQAVFLPLIPLEGIVARTAEISDKARGAEGIQIQLFRVIYKKTPSKIGHWRGFLDYLTIPAAKPFKTISAMQDHFISVIVPSIKNSITTLDGLIAESAKSKFMMNLDLSLLIGAEKVSQLRGKDHREFSVGLAELHLIKGYYERLLGLGYYLSGYDLDGATDLSQSIGQNYLAQMLVGKSFAFPLFSSRDLSVKLEDKSMINLFILKDKTDSKTHALRVALDFFKKSNKSLTDAWMTMMAQKDAGRFFKLEAPILSFADLTDDRLQMNFKLLNSKDGVDVVDDLYAKNSVRVNVNALFDPTNIRIHDLKKLFPHSKLHFTKLTNAWNRHGGSQSVPNYYLGKKMGLPDPSLGGVLPEVRTFESLIEAERVLERRQIGFPLLAWMELFI